GGEGHRDEGDRAVARQRGRQVEDADADDAAHDQRHRRGEAELTRRFGGGHRGRGTGRPPGGGVGVVDPVGHGCLPAGRLRRSERRQFRAEHHQVGPSGAGGLHPPRVTLSAGRGPRVEAAGVTGLRWGAMAATPSALQGRLGWAIGIVVVVLAGVNVADYRVPHATLVLGPAGAAALLVLARWAGLSWQELGLGRGTWRRGLTWAAAEIGAVAVVFAAGAALPAPRSAFRDARYHHGWGQALLTAFVLIPVGTVLFEEVAFRGVLWGLLRRVRGTWTATIVSSVLFGLWHVLPSLGLAAENEALRSAVGQSARGQAGSGLGTGRVPAL